MILHQSSPILCETPGNQIVGKYTYTGTLTCTLGNNLPRELHGGFIITASLFRLAARRDATVAHIIRYRARKHGAHARTLALRQSRVGARGTRH